MGNNMDLTEKRKQLSRMTGPLCAWYEREARELPWRGDPGPYQVWVSEIMLQQTRIEAVKPYYDRFLSALPDIPALAAAPEEQVLKLWEGLGYYSRARNLQRAAVLCVERHGGRLPDSYEELLALPGIGSYTAGAVASIAFGIPVPAVDGNVLRVLARFFADGRETDKGPMRRETGELLSQVIPSDRPGIYNQALMEVGETVCVPKGAPDCDRCPLAAACLAEQAGTQQVYPVRSPKRERRIEERTILLLTAGGKTAVRRRPDRGLLAGMYEFPGYPGNQSLSEVTDRLRAQGAKVREAEPLGPAKHIFTHVEWRMTGYRILLEEEFRGDWIYVSPERLAAEYPLPGAFRYYQSCLMEAQ